MPRHRKRTSSRGSWLQSDMEKAIEEVQKGGKIKTVARTFNVPRTTLYRHLFGEIKKPRASTHLGREPVLGSAHERELLKHILEFEKRGFPLTVADIRGLDFEYATVNRIPNNFSKDHQKAGLDWWAGFRSRFGEFITIRKPQALSIQRAIHLNKPVVRKFFELLEKMMFDHSLFGEPGRIYNADETGLNLVPGVKNIVGSKGSRISSQITSGERGQTQTVVMAVNAAGDYIPPMIIFKGKRANPLLEQDLPPASIVKYSDTGYINKELFYEWIQHFCNHKKFHTGKVLLILDGHGSHTRCDQVLQYAADNGVEIVSLPAHSSHYLQPLDRVHFKPLKDHYKEAVRVQLRNNPGTGVSRLNFPRLFTKAYFKVCTVGNAVSSFKTTGIFPLDKDVIPESAYAPSLTTHRDLVNDMTSAQEGLVDQATTSTHRDLADLTAISAHQDLVRQTHVDGADIDQEEQIQDRIVSGPSCPETSANRSFEEVLPFPKAPPRKKPPRNKSIETSIRVLTSETYRKELSEVQKHNTTPRTKNKNQKKIIPKKRPVQLSNEDEDNSENVCGFCEGNFFEDNEEEGWIQCQMCGRWFHDICAGVYGKPVLCFVCEDCKR